MRVSGFEPVCVEGKSGLVDSLKLPPKIIRHRPDLIGVNKNYEICIGEAKTMYDIHSKRTKEQIEDYYKAGCNIIIGCPSSCYEYSSNLIKKILPNLEKATILKIPEELMPNDELQIEL